MNAAAYLKSRGWRGKGHALHADKGLATPLLISRNTDGRGVGHTANDQWWLQAFDQKLKGLDVSKKGLVTQTVTAGKLDSVSAAKGKYSGLYAAFVSGGLMIGTITPDLCDEATDATPASEDREHVPGLKDGVKTETKEERRARRDAKRARKGERAARRAVRAKRRSAGAVKPKATDKRARKEAKQTADAAETKEQRRARRAERRARKEARRRRREKRASVAEG